MLDRRPLASLASAVLACELVGASGSVFTAAGLESWDPSLAKPALTSPNWVFGPVWTALFAFMGATAWLVWCPLAAPAAPLARRALWLFAGPPRCWSPTSPG